MKNDTVKEAELVTRNIARWGSLVAAIIFGVAFVTDERLSWEIVVGQADQIALMVAVFVGYALAWTQRFEALGSVIVVVAVVALCTVFWVKSDMPPDPFLLGVAAPALFHLGAVTLRRYAKRTAN